MWIDLITRHGKAVLGCVALVILIIIGYFVYITIDRNGKLPVVINVVPSDATITIDGKRVGTGVLYVTPGSHVANAKKEGFSDFSATQYIERKDQVINIPLQPQSDAAKEWARVNQTKYLELESKAGQAANQDGEAFRTKNPIVNLLPYKNLLYTIGYRNDTTDPTGNSIIIEIDAPEGYRQAAIYQLSQWGYDPTQFKINFRNYKNPFTS